MVEDIEAILANPFACEPIIFDGSYEHTKQREALIRAGRVWKLHDTLEQQLDDLIKARHPQHQRFNVDELRARRESLVSGIALPEFGRWVYYPWSGVMAHLLPPAEYRELRLDRNQYKITPDEQARLSQWYVGIVGLSVGNAVAISLALEEACGHLKLADFDRLDLSNMNRLRAGIAELGLPKTVVVARQIYEFNPYANLSLFLAGVTSQNLDEFLLGTPRLDVVVDECDDIAMKIRLRERARSLQLPVLMETSDRGMLDIERFDLEPERPLLHGLIGDIKAADITPTLSDEEKIKLILPLVGVATLSTRAAASMVEIKQTISTWPQLGSEVALGGATVTAAVRRMALGQPLPSGRHYIDVEAILSGQRLAMAGQAKPSSFRLGKTDPAQLQVPGNAVFPEFVRFVVEHGILAPSAGNSQPWKFGYVNNELLVIHDRQRSKNLLDGDSRAAYLALGAAILNIAVAAAHRGCQTHIKPFPQPAHRSPTSGDEIVASLSFIADAAVTHSAIAQLFPLLRQRVTNRKLAQRAPFPDHQQRVFESLATGYGCPLYFYTGEAELAELGDILGEGDRLRFLCADLHRELIAEIRWTPEEARITQDGLELASLELTESQTVILKLLARRDSTAFLRRLRAGSALTSIAHKAARAASAFGLIRVNGDSPADIVRGGQAIEHLWLKANELGWALHPMTAPLYMFDLLDSPNELIFQPWEVDHLAALRNRFDLLFPSVPDQPRLMLFRLSPATDPSARSLRRPVERVLFAE